MKEMLKKIKKINFSISFISKKAIMIIIIKCINLCMYIFKKMDIKVKELLILVLINKVLNKEIKV